MPDAVPEPIEDPPTARLLPFANRIAAGHHLGRALSHHAGTDAVVLGIASGGLAVAESVANALGVELDLWIVHLLRAADNARLPLGAVSEGGAVVFNQNALAQSGLTMEQLRALATQGVEVTLAMRRRYMSVRMPLEIRDKTVILVDEGAIAASALMAAIAGIRRRCPSKIVVALPVGTPSAIANVRTVADEVVCLASPARLRRVGAWYRDFRQVSDSSVVKILAT